MNVGDFRSIGRKLIVSKLFIVSKFIYIAP